MALMASQSVVGTASFLSPNRAPRFNTFRDDSLPLTTFQPSCTTTAVFNQRRDNSDSEDLTSGSSSFSAIDAVDRLGSILAQPLPLVQVAAGWVLVLLTQAAIAGVVPAIVAAVLFGTLRAVAQNLVVFEETLDEDVYGITAGAAGKTVDEQEEEEQTLQLQIDGATMVLSIFTAQLLVPDEWISVSTAATTVFPILALLALVALLLKNAVGEIAQEEELTKDDKLLNQWDKKYRQQQTKSTDD